MVIPDWKIEGWLDRTPEPREDCAIRVNNLDVFRTLRFLGLLAKRRAIETILTRIPR